MSSQRGNAQRSRSQKHPNKTSFKNDLFDKTKKIQQINSLEICDVCQRCKEIIEWKIKYKKYKPLTAPKKCTICSEKTVKRAYYIMCVGCAKEKNVCAKCGGSKDIVQSSSGLTPSEEAAEEAELQREIGMLSERQRRKFFRLQEQGKLTKDDLLASARTNAGSGEDSDIEILKTDDEEDSDIEIISRNNGQNNGASCLENTCSEKRGFSSQLGNEREHANCFGSNISGLSLVDKS